MARMLGVQFAGYTCHGFEIKSPGHVGIKGEMFGVFNLKRVRRCGSLTDAKRAQQQQRHKGERVAFHFHAFRFELKARGPGAAIGPKLESARRPNGTPKKFAGMPARFTFWESIA